MTPPVVIKVGGAAGIAMPEICAGVADLTRAGQPVVVVHGGSAERDALGAILGVPTPTFISPSGIASRYTSDEGIDVLLLALSGRVKPRLLGQLASHGVSAVGLTGLDGAMLRAVAKPVRRVMVDGRPVVLRGDRGGRLVHVDPALPALLISAGHVPVVSPPVLTDGGDVVNVNADRIAAALAAALGASQLLFLTAAPGLLAIPGDEASVLPGIELAGSGPLPAAGGGMALKLIAAREALAGGVSRVVIADGRSAGPIRAALDGGGTAVALAADIEEPLHA